MKLAIAAALFLGVVLFVLPGEPAKRAEHECAHVGLAYCGCPNKKQCAFDDDKDCGGCCSPNPCRGGPPTRSP